MSAATLFSIFNTAILPAWSLLVLAPRWQWTQKLVGSGLVSFIFALGYAALLIIYIGESKGGFSSLEDVQQGAARIKWALDPNTPAEIMAGDRKLVRDWL